MRASWQASGVSDIVVGNVNFVERCKPVVVEVNLDVHLRLEFLEGLITIISGINFIFHMALSAFRADGRNTKIIPHSQNLLQKAWAFLLSSKKAIEDTLWTKVYCSLQMPYRNQYLKIFVNRY